MSKYIYTMEAHRVNEDGTIEVKPVAYSEIRMHPDEVISKPIVGMALQMVEQYKQLVLTTTTKTKTVIQS